MGIRESLLNTITSVADSDFVRVVTSAGASSKATVQNLFKSFETGLGAKSSLTTSDYIRVVGSDNVSYKQLVSDVAEKIVEDYTSSSLGGINRSIKSAFSAAVVGKGTITSLASDTDIINMEAGMYQVQLSANTTYLPYRWGLLTIDYNSNYGLATFISATSDTRIYQRAFSRTNLAWYNSWTQVSTTDITRLLTSYEVIPANSDLNSYTNVGSYCQSAWNQATTIANNPTNTAFRMIVESSSGSTGNYLHRRQIISPYNSSDVYTRIITTTNGGSSWTYNAWVKEPTRSEVDAMNSNMRLIYTGTAGFAAIDPAHPNDTKYMGGVLDAKVKGVISSLPAGMQLIHGTTNGPAFGIVLDKTNDTNYSGIVFTYNASYGKTAWFFSYAGSTYTLRPLSLTI